MMVAESHQSPRASSQDRSCRPRATATRARRSAVPVEATAGLDPLVRTMCPLRLRRYVALSLSRGVVVKRYPCGPKFAKVVVFNFVVSINFNHSKQK